MAILSKVTGFWDSLSFVKNTKRMRGALMDYLAGEGVKCEVKDGGVLFCYEDHEYEASFVVEGDCAECVISGGVANDTCEALPAKEKAIVADIANGRCGYNTKVCTFDECIAVTNCFCFTSRRMMLQLFVKHLEQLDSSLHLVEHIVDKMAGQCNSPAAPRRQIGFIVQGEDSEGGKLKISAQNN